MSLNTRNPLRMAGANVFSSGLNTGEFTQNIGGSKRFTAFSGGLRSLGSGTGGVIVTQAVDHVVLWSGPGRLKTAFQFQAGVSGIAAFFYDSAVAARSGPGTFIESGYSILGMLRANSPIGIVEGTQISEPIIFDTPFHSGLCANGSSGIPGFTVTWIPDLAQAQEGN